MHGEDRGAEFAYVLAATRPDRVKTLCFAEMLLSGEGLEEWSFFTPDNVAAQFNLKGVWVWHIPFFWIPHLPEMLITGHEREFWEFFGELVEAQMLKVAEKVDRAEVFQECGHSLALEAEDRLASLLREFMLGR